MVHSLLKYVEGDFFPKNFFYLYMGEIMGKLFYKEVAVS